MVTKKDLVIAILCTFCLTVSLFMIIPTRSSPDMGNYDPWIDVNDDGVIDISDLVIMVGSIPSSGQKINKTALLLELQTRIDSLNSSLLNLEAYLNTKIVTLETSLVELQSRLEALEARIPKKGYISISPAAFTPESNTQTYYKYYSYLRGQGDFYASLQLPDGATITNMTVLLWDNSNTGRIEFYLMGFNITKRYPLTMPMAGVATTDSGTPGEVILYDDTISDAIIDNRDCEYALWAHFSKDDISLVIRGIVLEYEYPT